MVENIASKLKEHSEQNGESLAIIHDARRITYRELWKLTQVIMCYFTKEGIKKGDRVVLLLQNSPEYVAAYYATLALGAIAVPLNVATKYRDLSNWIGHSGAKWLIAQDNHPELSAILDTFKGKVLIYDKSGRKEKESLWPTIEEIKSESDNLEFSIAKKVLGKTPASIIYTSGTTGQPKGVTISHENLITNTRSIIEYLRLERGDSIVNVLPFYYSYGNSILHTHIYVGATLVLANSMIFPRKILELIEQERVTGFSGVPSTYALLLNRTQMSDFDLSSLRYMTQAGGPMPPKNIERIQNLLPDVQFYVMYGQTEATARLSYLPTGMLKEKMGSIGIAIPGVELEIRDKKGIKVKPREVGEIYARGKNIMIGYWDDINKTRTVIKKGWLKTGDLARYDEDGYLYIVGRSSEMIKTGANRVSPKDVEEVIIEVDGVEEVAVVGIQDDMLGQVIKAFVVKNKNMKIEKKEIMAYCKENLATYKIPKELVFVDSIPKTASGKVQRYKLN